MKFLNGTLLDGTSYTIRVKSGVLVFQRCEDRHTVPGPAGLLDYLKVQGWELPAAAVARLHKLAYQGADVVQSLLEKRGHYHLVTADDIQTAVQQKIEPGIIREAIRTLLLSRVDK